MLVMSDSKAKRRTCGKVKDLDGVRLDQIDTQEHEGAMKDAKFC